jgi:hypothetical protein
MNSSSQFRALQILLAIPWASSTLVRAGRARAKEITLRLSVRRDGRSRGASHRPASPRQARGRGKHGPRAAGSPSRLQFNPGLISSTIQLIGTGVHQFRRVSQEAFQSLTLRSVSPRHPPNHDAQSPGRDPSSRAGRVRSPGGAH